MKVEEALSSGLNLCSWSEPEHRSINYGWIACSSFTLNSIEPVVRDARLPSCRWWNSEALIFFFLTLLGVISCSRSSSSAGRSSWKPRKTTSRKRTGIKLSGHTMSQINNKAKHSCLLSLVTMAAGCLALQAVVWVIYRLQGSDCLCLCYYALRSETGQSNDCSTWSRRVIDDDSLWCQRSQLREEQDWNRNTQVLSARYMTRGDGQLYSPQVAQRSPGGKLVCPGRIPSPCCVLRLPR